MSEMEFWEGAATYNPLRCLLYYHFVFAFGFFLNKKLKNIWMNDFIANKKKCTIRQNSTKKETFKF